MVEQEVQTTKYQVVFIRILNVGGEREKERVRHKEPAFSSGAKVIELNQQFSGQVEVQLKILA